VILIVNLNYIRENGQLHTWHAPSTGRT